nr:uncharacterized protein LOC109193259 [Ipomoea batatas]
MDIVLISQPLILSLTEVTPLLYTHFTCHLNLGSASHLKFVIRHFHSSHCYEERRRPSFVKHVFKQLRFSRMNSRSPMSVRRSSSGAKKLKFSFVIEFEYYGNGNCRYFEWLDSDSSERVAKVIRGLLKRLDKQETEMQRSGQSLKNSISYDSLANSQHVIIICTAPSIFLRTLYAELVISVKVALQHQSALQPQNALQHQSALQPQLALQGALQPVQRLKSRPTRLCLRVGRAFSLFPIRRYNILSRNASQIPTSRTTLSLG